MLDRLVRGEAAPSSPLYIPPAGIVERRSIDNLAADHPQVQTALRFIRDHSHELISMAGLVKHVAMSRSGLEKAFREHNVLAPMEELRHTHLTHGKRLLREASEKIAAIARLTGFQTSQNLCRTFREQLGLTPKQYRAVQQDRCRFV
ncbi:MAG: helix-turn-helix domain-containing protein [Bryobacteraceae bacterium]|nr:helix-turn-helix domain-containing protein [Bryobacteraceae bacterium]